MAMAIPSQMYGRRSESLIVRAHRVVQQQIQSMLDWLEASARPREPQTAEELIEWANAHRATQPSYAADLYAVALHHQAQQDRAAR